MSDRAAKRPRVVLKGKSAFGEEDRIDVVRRSFSSDFEQADGDHHGRGFSPEARLRERPPLAVAATATRELVQAVRRARTAAEESARSNTATSRHVKEAPPKRRPPHQDLGRPRVPQPPVPQKAAPPRAQAVAALPAPSSNREVQPQGAAAASGAPQQNGAGGAAGFSGGGEPAAPAPPRPPAATVKFNVGGQLFRVPAKVIRSRPEGRTTLLGQLLDIAEEGKKASKPIFVNTAPERFSYILDWFRYGEIHLPQTVALAALLQDARQLRLPAEIVVNGAARSTRPNVAHKVARTLIEAVIKGWTDFNVFFDGVLDCVGAHYRNVAASAGPNHLQDTEEAYDFPPFVFPLYGEKGWVEPRHVCSAARARVLALKLEERGFCCEFTEVELIVHLGLRLRGEVGDFRPEEPPPPEDAVAQGLNGLPASHGQGGNAT